uniref:Cytochrome n=1 Tax=Lutzomyia longipalpis TaxID=7200 RepID=A0A1B0CWX6_LUTLO
MIWLVLLIVAIALFIYRWNKRQDEKRAFYESKGIPVLPQKSLFSSILFLLKMLSGRLGLVEIVQDVYYGVREDEKVVGVWDGDTPVIMLRDPDVVKHFGVKEFEHFQDRREFITEEMDELFGNSLFVLREQKWRDMRSTLSPAFTGSKMRLMCDLIVEIGLQTVEYLQNEAKENGLQTYEMKELLSRVSHDVIATCAFGLKVDSLTHKENEVYLAGKELSDFASLRKIIKLMFYKYFPKLTIMLGIKSSSTKEADFFKSLVLDSMKLREQQNIIRPDMIHLLIEAQKGKLSHGQVEKDSAGFATVDESSVGWTKSGRKWTENELVAQCFLFFLAGFESVSASLSFATYEIGINPDIQEKLYEEVKSVNDELKGQRINYDTLQKMKYMDMVVSETLRKYAPAPVMDRECNKDITLELYENKQLDFKKKYVVWIPVYSFHWDPKYFPNPEKFDPERFNDENKHLINPYSYIPFGVGPRNCIGSRFALMELKSILYYLVLNFKLEPTEKTQIPLKFAKSFGTIKSEQKEKRAFFESKGIKVNNPKFFLITMFKLLTGQIGIVEMIQQIYYEVQGDPKVVGFWDGNTPIIMLKDPDVVKHFAVKEFEHFQDRRDFISEEMDPLFGNSLFVLREQKWKDMRSTLSPAFTGSKMRLIFALMELKTVLYYLVLNFKLEPTEKTQIPLKFAKSFGTLQSEHSMKLREQQNIIRPDMIHLLIEAQKGKLSHGQVEKDSAGFATVDESSVGWTKSGRKWTENELVAQCFLFFLAGFESVSASLSFATYEIGINPDIQEKLYEEVKSVNDELKGQRINYDTLQKMKYMDMVVSETLRKYAPAPVMDRECNKDITLELYENKQLDFKKKYVVWIPVYSFHWDPKYFPNPEKFDPERFNDENKHLINPYSYIPFGVGPRNCIGSRFALMELKSILYYLVLNFKLEPTEKTQIPLKFAKSFGTIKSEHGIYLQLRPRNST